MAFVLFVIDTATRMRNLSNTRWQHEATTKTSRFPVEKLLVPVIWTLIVAAIMMREMLRYKAISAESNTIV